MINYLQMASALVVAALYGLAYFLGHRHIHAALAGVDPSQPRVAPSMGFQARLLVAIATLLAAALLVWRTLSRAEPTPLAHYLDAFLVLALLLAVALIHLRWTRNLVALSFYILPMIVIVLVLGIILEIANPGPFRYLEKAWAGIHLVAIIVGSLCFALASVGGIVYLAAARNLKTKKMGAARSPRLPSLGSLEKFNRWMVYLGFPLLTIAIVAGALSILNGGADQPKAKLVSAAIAWSIYALLLPLAPAFRGRRAAWLSIVGFFVILSGYAAATFIK